MNFIGHVIGDYLVGGLEHEFYVSIYICIYIYIENSNPNGLIFLRGVETTNQMCSTLFFEAVILRGKIDSSTCS